MSIRRQVTAGRWLERGFILLCVVVLAGALYGAWLVLGWVAG